VELFVENAGNITSEDIYDLILEDKDYPLGDLDAKGNFKFPAKITHPEDKDLKCRILKYLELGFDF